MCHRELVIGFNCRRDFGQVPVSLFSHISDLVMDLTITFSNYTDQVKGGSPSFIYSAMCLIISEALLIGWPRGMMTSVLLDCPTD